MMPTMNMIIRNSTIFHSPGDWRDRNNGYPEFDHAQANNRIIAAIDARLFAQPPKRSSMKCKPFIFQHAD